MLQGAAWASLTSGKPSHITLQDSLPNSRTRYCKLQVGREDVRRRQTAPVQATIYNRGDYPELS